MIAGWSSEHGEPGLAQEALPEANILGELGREQLQLHVPVQGKVVRAVNNTHTAATEPMCLPFRRRYESGRALRASLTGNALRTASPGCAPADDKP